MRLRPFVAAAFVLGASLLAIGLADRDRPAQSQAPLANDFTNFESHPVHPICLSPSGNRLFAVNVPDARLSVFDIAPATGALTLVDEIPVGLEPVSVAALSDNVVWVVDHLSDDVSVVDVTAGNVIRTIKTGDEPTDVVFAKTSPSPGAPTVAFVCLSQPDLVQAYDPATFVSIGAPIAIAGKDPRALALSADRTQVYTIAFESGNRTTVVPFQEVKVSEGGLGLPAPVPAMRADLPPAPEVGLVVQHDGAKWADEIGRNWSFKLPYSVADKDLFVIDAASRTVTQQVTGVGTLLFNLALHPVSGQLWVTNTEALNLTRFEPNLRGRFVRNRVSIVDPLSGTVNAVHLNPHINYAVTPGSAGEIAQSLAQPTDIRFTPDGAKAYVAALGSNKLGVLDGTTGAVTGRVAVGKGPVGLAMASGGQRLYVYNRFDNTISIVATASDQVTGTVSLGFDPTPANIRTGRPFLYDAALTSGHGDASCASCHAFANNDNLAWDLGDPQGNFQDKPPGQIDPALEGFHPMKGPMATQSLRGLPGTGRLHWRADRETFNSFNGAFVSLNGRGDSLSAGDMQAYTDFILTVRYPPNPNRYLNNGLPNPALAPSAFRGQNEYMVATHDAFFTCNNCHLVPTGTNGQLINDAALLEDQDMKIPHMRNLYEKDGFSRTPGAANKSGIGFTHDGAFDNLVTFLNLQVFQFPGGDAQRRDLEAFLLAFDTGMRPSVGRRLTLHTTNRDLPATTTLLDSLYSAADSQHCDLVVLGKSGGLKRGWLYDRVAKTLLPDRVSEPSLSKAALRALVADGSELTWFGVPPSSGLRMAIDRDRDGYRNRDELDAGSNPGNPESTPANVAVLDPSGAVAGRIALASPAPNPFGSRGGTATTTLRFSLPVAADVELEIYDALGRHVVTLLDGRQPAGAGTATWDGRDAGGRPVGAGLYFYRLSALGQRATQKGLRL